nr:hypothetical protein CFP56_46789 [Quercus suber]
MRASVLGIFATALAALSPGTTSLVFARALNGLATLVGIALHFAIVSEERLCDIDTLASQRRVHETFFLLAIV